MKLLELFKPKEVSIIMETAVWGYRINSSWAVSFTSSASDLIKIITRYFNNNLLIISTRKPKGDYVVLKRTGTILDFVHYDVKAKWITNARINLCSQSLRDNFKTIPRKLYVSPKLKQP